MEARLNAIGLLLKHIPGVNDERDSVPLLLKIRDAYQQQPPPKDSQPSTEKLVEAAQVCRNTYCALIPGKRTWAELTDQERDVDILCLLAAWNVLSDAFG